MSKGRVYVLLHISGCVTVDVDATATFFGFAVLSLSFGVSVGWWVVG